MRNFQRLFVLTLICGLPLFLMPGSVQAAAGDLDPTYGNGGKVTTPTSFFISDAAVQTDGKIIAVGDFVARYKLNGSLDPTFGSGGRVFLSSGFYANAVVIQPDGKIIAAGRIVSVHGPYFQGTFALMRLNRNGSLDTTFGAGGLATIRFLPDSWDRINDVALQPDGKIVVAGAVDFDNWFALARFKSDGSPDTSFGDQGRVRTGMGAGEERAEAVAIQADLKIVVAGGAAESPDSFGVDNFALARYKSNGQLDETFGNGGTVSTDFNGSYDSALSVVVQSDGNIVAAGYAYSGTKQHFALARYDENGSLDPTFENNGKVLTSFSGSAGINKILLQSDGRIVAAGNGVAGADPDAFPNDFIVARYNLNGSLDDSFGNQGTVVTDFGGDNRASTIVLQPDGKVVVGGHRSTDAALARYIMAATNSPVLQTESDSSRALAFDSVTLVRDPFTVTTELNFSADHRTRVLLFATNLTLLSGESFSAITVQARRSGSGIVYLLPVEYVGEVAGFEWLTEVVVKLPDELVKAGNVQVSISLRGETSNVGVIHIQ